MLFVLPHTGQVYILLMYSVYHSNLSAFFFNCVQGLLQVRAILIMLQGLEFVIQCAQITVVERFSKFGR
jgi:hypothetical protein